MARLLTYGPILQETTIEMRSFNGIFGTTAIDTTTKRLGLGASVKCTGANSGFDFVNITTAQGNNIYARLYINISSMPTGAKQPIITLYDSVGLEAYVALGTDGKLSLWDQITGTDTQIGSSTAALSTGTWYMVEMRGFSSATAGKDELEARLDGASFASGTGSYIAGTSISYALGFDNDFGATGHVAYFSDLAVNDSTGSAQTSWPGEGKVIWVPVISDSAVGTGWEQPKTSATDSTALYDSLDNLPPVGVTHSDVDANNLKYIFNAASNATTNYDANLQKLSDIGLTTYDTLTLMRAVAVTGSSSATDTSGAIALTSNPADSGETSMVYDNGVQGTFPTNWEMRRGAIVYSPSVTLTTSGVVRLGKRTATTRVATSCALGALLEYVPGTPPSGRRRFSTMV